MIEFLREHVVVIIGVLVTGIGGLWAYFTKKRKERAATVTIEEQNTDIIINRLAADNKALLQERNDYKTQCKQLQEENETLLEKNDQLLEELHQLKIKIAELTNEVTRLEVRFRLVNK